MTKYHIDLLRRLLDEYEAGEKNIEGRDFQWQARRLYIGTMLVNLGNEAIAWARSAITYNDEMLEAAK